MQRHLRRLLFVCLIALYGPAALGGQALHALPGLGHADRHDDCDDGGHPGRDAASHDDCPVCHLASQSQFLAAGAIEILIDVVRVPPPDDAPPAPLPSTDLPSNPRAPPLG